MSCTIKVNSGTSIHTWGAGFYRGNWLHLQLGVWLAVLCPSVPVFGGCFATSWAVPSSDLTPVTKRGLVLLRRSERFGGIVALI